MTYSMGTRKLKLIIATIVATLAIIIALTGQSLQLVWVLFLVVTGAVFVARVAVDVWVNHLQRRSDNLYLDLLLSGAAEAEWSKLQSRAMEIKDRCRTLMRQAGVYRDAGERAKMLLEVNGLNKDVDALLDNIEIETRDLRRRRQKMVQLRTKERMLAEELDQLRRKTSAFYNARKTLEELVMSAQKTDELVNQDSTQRV